MSSFRNFLIRFTSTFFYVGYLPLIPGTFGSLAGILLYYLVRSNAYAYVFLTAILVIAGFLVAGEAERLMDKKDARCIVIDEVSGMLLALLFIPYEPGIIILGFFLFRLLDTLKPYPAGCLERLKGSVGIMSDDLLAAVYTNIILQVVLRLASFRSS